ncbi:MAG: MFS transporter [Pseudomonadota bacterium]|nr:MFS transporter [Pseudomonadota bacterium]
MSSAAPENVDRKLGPFHLMPGITKFNGVSYFVTAALAIPMIAALSFLQPLMMRVVGVDRAIQGTLSGDLVFYQEIIVLLITPFIGASADKIGRRPLVMFGVAMLGLGYSFYPFADSIFMMYAYRTIFAFGIAMVATSITIVNVDYVQDRSRGKWVALASMTQGIAVFTATQLLRLIPIELAKEGYDEAEIAKALFWGCAIICSVIFLLATSGLSRSKPKEARERDSLMTLLKAGVQAAKDNPRIALAYSTAFAARGDVLVVGTFGFLWTQQAAEDLGYGAVEGYKQGGFILGVIFGSALLWSPFMGYLMDKLDRVTGVIIGFTLAATGYTLFGLIDDPFSSAIIIPAIILGMGENSTIISGNSLMGQTAPPAIRGAVLGAFALCGAAGILVATSIGGRLFDLVGPGAPFVQMGVINGLVLLAAIFVRMRTSGPR